MTFIHEQIHTNLQRYVYMVWYMSYQKFHFHVQDYDAWLKNIIFQIIYSFTYLFMFFYFIPSDFALKDSHICTADNLQGLEH